MWEYDMISRRRLDMARKKRQARKIYKYMGDDAVKLADHLRNCSCVLCGNPRKYFKKRTLQEMKFFEVDDGIFRW